MLFPFILFPLIVFAQFTGGSYDGYSNSSIAEDTLVTQLFTGGSSDGYASSEVAADNSLPVELSTFTAQLLNGEARLHWVTESETDNLGFNVYRSLNKNEHYRKINGGLIEGAGNSSQKNEYTYVDNDVVKGFTCWYKLEDVDYEGQGTMHGPISPQKDEQEQAPQFRLSPAYPNPFNPVTNLAYEIPKNGNVKLVVYNLEGKVVNTLVNCKKTAGEYELEWNGTNQSGSLVSSGLYFVTITSGNYKKTNKVVFLR